VSSESGKSSALPKIVSHAWFRGKTLLNSATRLVARN